TYGSRSSTSSGVRGSTRSPALRSDRAPSPAPTRTRPASRRAWARVRVEASPRSTRSWSRRTRPVRVTVGLTRLSWHRALHADVAVGRIGQPRLLDDLEDGGPEAAADHTLLEGDDEAFAACCLEDELAVDRLRESRVDDADAPALGLERIGRGNRPLDDRSE